MSKPMTALRRLTCYEITHNPTEFLNVLNWFSYYFANRTQTTQIFEQELGHWSPTRFCSRTFTPLIYINYIYTCSDKLRFYLFADDTNLLQADKNLQSPEAVVNNE